LFEAVFGGSFCWAVAGRRSADEEQRCSRGGEQDKQEQELRGGRKAVGG
jgi:hypothetical protein